MKPTDTASRYDKISAWWRDHETRLTAGIDFVQKALQFSAGTGNALDVGCGSGGRIINALLNSGFRVTGIDVSQAQLEHARERHPNADFILADICQWQVPKRFYDVVIAWDSIFHVPYPEQRRVVRKLCGALTGGGVIVFTAGGVDGEISGQMRGQDFYYSSLAEEEYLKILKENGCRCVLMERDQHPEEHVVFIGVSVPAGNLIKTERKLTNR